MRRSWCRMSHSNLWRDRKGVAALEFALVAPVFIVMYVVGVDLVFLIENRFRIEQAAISGLQVVTQFTSLYDDDFTNTIFPVFETIAGNGSNKTLTDPTQVACAATISGLDYPIDGARSGMLSIVWQKSYSINHCSANQVVSFDSSTGIPVALVLNNYTPPIGVPFIVVEVASQYKLFGQSAIVLGASQQQYSAAMAIPRQRVLPRITLGNRP